MTSGLGDICDFGDLETLEDFCDFVDISYSEDIYASGDIFDCKGIWLGVTVIGVIKVRRVQKKINMI